MGVKEYFTCLKENEMDFYIELGDIAKYQATSAGMVKFQRLSDKPFLVEDVLYILSMTKTLILLAILVYKGYIVSFEEGKVYIIARTQRQPKW